MSKSVVWGLMLLMSLLLLVGCEDDAVSPEETAAVEWYQVHMNSDTIPVSNNYTVEFYNDLNGWIAGDAGNIHKTTDGGATWNLAYRNDYYYFFDIYPLTATNVWAVGMTQDYNSVLVNSTDGGTTWNTSAFRINAQLTSVRFIDSLNGFSVGGGWFNAIDSGCMVYTINGGTGWIETICYRDTANQKDFFSTTVLADPNLVELVDNYKFNDLDFGSVDIGCAVGENHTIFTTVNPDSVWTKADSLPQSKVLYNGLEHNIDFWAVDMLDALNGWVVGSFNTIMNTSDGGLTWNLQYITETTPSSLRAVSFIDLNNGVAVGDDNLILKTTDGGNSWVKSSFNNSNYNALTDVHYIGADKIVIVGEDFLILTSWLTL